MKIVPQQDATTLLVLPIINCHVAPGTIVWSDQWAAYNRVSSLPNINTHGTVNHSIEFVNSVTGVHKQNIELYCQNKDQAHEKMSSGAVGQLPR